MVTKTDAIALLKADHRKVEDLFEKFEAATDNASKKALCNADLHRAVGACHDRRGDLLPGLQGQGGEGPDERVLC